MGEVVGIDLGTTFSVISRVNEAGLPEIIPNLEGEKTTPSVVFFDGDAAVVGTVAREAMTTSPESVVQLVKRQMGSRWTFMHQGIDYRPEQISALILRKVVQDAEAIIGPVDSAVITVPAYFNDAMRHATELAGQMADLDVLALINEPTAAAIAFGLQRPAQDGVIAVCDLGGGTFDVTVMNVLGSDMQVMATGGDNFLGGTNFDKRIYDFFTDCFRAQFGVDVNDPYQVDLADLAWIGQEWLKRAERLKRDLTTRHQASTALTALGKTMRLDMTRVEFEQMSAVLVEEIEERIVQTLGEAGVEPRQVRTVLLVGGATRMPMIRTLVQEIFHQAPNSTISPDEAVALGAALFGATRALGQGKVLRMPDNRRRHLRAIHIVDVASHSIGVKAYDNPPEEGGRLYNAVILQRNVSLPFAGSETFYASQAGQTTIAIEILEGDEADPALCSPIASLKIRGLPSNRPADMPVEVTMRYNENGILEVEAVDLTTGLSAHAVVDRSSALSPREREAATEAVHLLAVE